MSSQSEIIASAIQATMFRSIEALCWRLKLCIKRNANKLTKQSTIRVSHYRPFSHLRAVIWTHYHTNLRIVRNTSEKKGWVTKIGGKLRIAGDKINYLKLWIWYFFSFILSWKYQVPSQNWRKYNVVNATDQRRWSEYSQRPRTISQSSTVCIANTL